MFSEDTFLYSNYYINLVNCELDTPYFNGLINKMFIGKQNNEFTYNKNNGEIISNIMNVKQLEGNVLENISIMKYIDNDKVNYSIDKK